MFAASWYVREGRPTNPWAKHLCFATRQAKRGCFASEWRKSPRTGHAGRRARLWDFACRSFVMPPSPVEGRIVRVVCLRRIAKRSFADGVPKRGLGTRNGIERKLAWDMSSDIHDLRAIVQTIGTWSKGGCEPDHLWKNSRDSSTCGGRLLSGGEGARCQ